MYLSFDLSEQDIIHLQLFDEETLLESSTPGRNKELLEVVNDLLVEHGLNKNDVQGIMVVVGAGGFTSTRLAVTIANTFAYANQIPLLSISKDQIGEVQSLISLLLTQPPGHYISATYSGMPNLGGNT